MDIKNLMFNLKYDTKYQILRRIYPEIDKFMCGNKYSLTYKECATINDYYKDCIKQYNKNCIPVETIYQFILDNLVILIKKIKQDPTPIEIMYIFSYLYYNGYLSLNCNFKFVEPDYELFFKKGFSVFTGKSVCRHVGILLSDILNKFNYTNYGIITDRYTFKSESIDLSPGFFEISDFKTDEEIEYGKKYIENLNENVHTSVGNHFEILVKSDKYGWQLLDPSELAVYKISKNKNNYKAIKYLRFWYLYSIGENSLGNCVKLYNLFKDKYLHLYKSNKFISFEENCFQTCEHNKQKIKKFHKEMYPYIEKLANAIPKKGLN